VSIRNEKQLQEQTDEGVRSTRPENKAKSVCLLPNLVNFVVPVEVCFLDHLLQFLIGHLFSNFLCDTTKILQRDLAGFVVVEQTEGLQDLLARITLAHFRSHHLQKLVEINRARA
jgi:hypothetical protein